MERACVARVRAENVKCCGREFTRDLVHVGNHQQQAPCLKSPMNRTSSTTFTLHFDYVRNGAPNIGGTPSDAHWSAHSPMVDDGVIG
jgi:hypothetical protein